MNRISISELAELLGIHKAPIIIDNTSIFPILDVSEVDASYFLRKGTKPRRKKRKYEAGS